MSDDPGRFVYEMPSLGADMDEGSVIEWRVEVGDEVERGQVVARVETEKSDIDIEIWHPGVVEEILVRPRRLVPVGAPLLRLRATGDVPAAPGGPDDAAPPAGEPAEQPVAEPSDEPVEQRPAETVPSGASPSARTAPTSGGVRATPWARRHAAEVGLDLETVAGSGPDGAVRRRDLPDAAPAPAVDEPAERDPEDRSRRMRSMIASRMERSNREIPHYHLAVDVDLGPLTDHLAEANAERSVGDRILPAAAFIRATALAAARHGELNGRWSDGFEPSSSVNLAVAISLRTGGLVTPQIVDADECDLDQTMERLREITMNARSGVMRSEATGAASTITVTNLGERGADLVHGVISPPEVALVGFGRVVRRPWVDGDAVVVRPVVTVTLAADHRATDGATGSRFLSTLARLLEHPEEL